MTFTEYCELLISEAASPACTIYRRNIDNFGYFETSKQNSFVYEFEYLPYYNELLEKFGLNKIAGKGNQFEKVLSLMQWLTNNTQYCGYSSLTPCVPEEILNYSFGKGFSGSINCANKAILLSDFLMSVGIFALPVWLENFVMDIESDYFCDGKCHCVVHVYINELNKWIMVDPSFNAYFVDQTNAPLHLVEIANSLQANGIIKLAQYSLNGTDFFKEKYADDFVFNTLIFIRCWRGNAFDKRIYDTSCHKMIPNKLDYIGFLKECYNDDRFSNEQKNFFNESIKHFNRIFVNEFLLKPQYRIM